MNDIPGLVFRVKGKAPLGIPIEHIMKVFDEFLHRAGTKVENRQYMKNPDRFAEMSEIELCAINGVVGVVRSYFPTLPPDRVVEATELVREWVQICYKSWGKGVEKKIFLPGDSSKSGEMGLV
jgi:hypothetical protein